MLAGARKAYEADYGPLAQPSQNTPLSLVKKYFSLLGLLLLRARFKVVSLPST